MSNTEMPELITTLRRRARHTGDHLWTRAAYELEQMTEALERIAALNYRSAATNCAAYEAHKIASDAVSSAQSEKT